MGDSQDSEAAWPVFLVVGLTGAGKSTFINNAINANLEVGRSMNSCTATSTCAVGKIKGVDVAFVDTPGFDDPEKSDADVLIDITGWIEKYLGGKRKVTAALYLHSIATKRMYGSASRNFRMFSSLVGSESMRNVGLVTTHWDVTTHADATDREAELVSRPWKLMIDHGARIYRLKNDAPSAYETAADILQAQPSFIKIQKEMAKEFQGKPLSRTDAGEAVYNELLDRIAKKRKDVQYLEEALAEGKQESPLLRDQLLAELELEKSRLARLENDRERVQKVPTWGEQIWQLTKTHGPALAMQGVTTSRCLALERELQASRQAATDASLATALVMGGVQVGMRLLGL